MPIAVGERVTLDESDTEYVVLSVDKTTGHVELLRLNPPKLESDVPISEVHKKKPQPPSGDR